ncbi:MAG: HDIG domain-containing protein [Armatimonadota bacterium]|nr:HDIG domain-containing protein [Armatimonadota bacterium]MCX7778259.1 HDIG domain-containing protein [Armatimonadota bacterium]MDW8025497.1 HDIG domain-containing protein [Armatimonadota bacterium]
MITRQQAWQWVCEWVSNENLRKHLLAVEAAMRHYARIYGQDEDVWGLAGLLHDIDYERHPEPPEHPQVGAQFLRENGVPQEIVEAILGHANWTGVPRNSLMAKALYACDELTGLLVATALVMPSKKLSEVKVDSVVRKMKDKSFARKVDRQAIVDGANELGMPLEEHIANVLAAMQGIAEQLGL